MIRRLAYKLYAFITAVAIIVLACGLALAMHTGVSKLPFRQYFSRTHTNAIWDWSNPLQKDNQSLRDISDFMYLHQLNTVYVNVDGYLPILAEKNADKRHAAQAQLDAALERYITTLHKRNIKVYAAAGDTSWSAPEKRYIPLSIMRVVQQYNDHHPNARFAGIEFDIEAYNQPGFAEGSVTTKMLALSDYLNLVDYLATNHAAYVSKTKQPFDFGVAIPYWFDNENGNIPSLTWHGKTGPTLYHLLDRLNELPQSNVVVMAYRNAARGNDGVIYHSRTEIEYAAARAPRVQIIIGQEVNEVEPAKITYYGSSLTELSSQVKMVEEEFAADRSYGGIAINDLAGLEAMEESVR